jgi:hypothetical protein
MSREEKRVSREKLTMQTTMIAAPTTAFTMLAPLAVTSSNQNKMSDGGRDRASLGVKM